MIQGIALAFLLLWTSWLSWYDSRVNIRLPLWGVLVPVIVASGVYEWTYRQQMVLITLWLGLLATNLSQTALRQILVILSVGLLWMFRAPPGLAFGWPLFYLGWEVKAWGGGDALLLLSWILVWPSTLGLLALVGGMFVWSIGRVIHFRGWGKLLPHLWQVYRNPARAHTEPGMFSVLLGGGMLCLAYLVH